MNKAINEGGVRTVDVSSLGSESCYLVSTFIHHELAPEKIQELLAFLEPLIVRAISIWVKL